MNETKIKANGLTKAIQKITKIAKTDVCHVKIIKMENEKTQYYLIRTSTLIHWQFWYDPKCKLIEMERI